MEVTWSEHGVRRLCLLRSVCPLPDIFLLRLLEQHNTPFSISDGINRDGGNWEEMQEVIWTAWLSSCLRICEFIVHLVCVCHCDSTRILSSDPGFVTCGPPFNENLDPLLNETYLEEWELPTSDIYEGCTSYESSGLVQRVRYCKHCDAHVKGFDHHCPAFGNCIGQNNHVLFMVLLAGFIIAEACFIVAASPIATARTLDSKGGKHIVWTGTLATSTMIFSLLQVLWQAVFLAWHIYCVCFNIRTDEFIHWKRYPEFQHITHPEPGETETTMRFKNPYDKGICQNLKEFIEAKG